MKKPLSLNSILIIIIALVVIINIAVVGSFLLNRKGVGNSSNGGSFGMMLTQPVTSVSGTVRSVGENRLEVEYLVMNAVLQPENSEPAKPEVVTFTVAIAPETTIFLLENPVPYVLTQGDNQARVEQREGSFSDISEGDTVSIVATTDLRELQRPEFIARSISVSSPINGLSGTVRSVSGNTITVEGTRISSQISFEPQIETFTVNISGTTEVAQLNNPTPNAQQTASRINSSDIRTDAIVTVYFEPTTGTTVNALSVQVVPDPSQGQSPPQATGSAQSVLSVTPSVQSGDEE
jgi:hypothetical protein